MLEVLAGAAVAALARWGILGRRRRRELAELAELEDVLEEWNSLATVRERREWLAGAQHGRRCSCGRWGMPLPSMTSVQDDWGRHARVLCQPEAETIP